MAQRSEQFAVVPEGASESAPRRFETREQAERAGMLLRAAASGGRHAAMRALASIDITRTREGQAIGWENVSDALTDALDDLARDQERLGLAETVRTSERALVEKYAPEVASGEHIGALAFDEVAEHQERMEAAAAGELEVALEDVDWGRALAVAERQRNLRDAMAMTGIRQLPSGIFAIGSPEHPEAVERVQPISAELAHAFLTAYLRGRDGHWGTEEREAFYRDIYAYLGEEYAGVPITDTEIIVAADATEPASPPLPLDERVAAVHETAAAWVREPGIVEAVRGAAVAQARRDAARAAAGSAVPGWGASGPSMTVALEQAATNVARARAAADVQMVIDRGVAEVEVERRAEAWQRTEEGIRRETAFAEAPKEGDRGAAEADMQMAIDRGTAELTLEQRIAEWLESGSERGAQVLERVHDVRTDARRAVATEAIRARELPRLPAAVVDVARRAYAIGQQDVDVRGRWSWLSERAGALIRGRIQDVQEIFRADANGAERRRRVAGWAGERAKGILTVGMAELLHVSRFDRARQEATNIVQELQREVDRGAGTTAEQRSARRESILDRAEERLMARLVSYRDEYGEMVLDPERLDRFRADLGARLAALEEADQRRAAKEVRDCIARNFDPLWYKRALYGFSELLLTAGGANVLVDTWISQPLALPAAKAAATGAQPTVTFLNPEVIAYVPSTDWSPMVKSIWHTMRGMYPDANAQQLTDAVRAVLRQNGMYDSTSAWHDLVRVLERAGSAGVDATALPDGYPIKGIASVAVRKIMGVAIGAVGV